MSNFIDLTGKSCGMWYVLSRAPNRKRVVFWNCLCECGMEKEVEASSLRDGSSKNCGCCRVHGGTGTREYNSYNAMKQRCKPDGGTYAAGLEIDPRWLGPTGFQAFREDMGPRPPGTTLDRIKGELGYGPGNCRWATPTTQTHNRRNTRMVTLDGERMPLGRAFIAMERAVKIGGSFNITTVNPPL